jgi:hypothetical protein
MVPLFPTFKLEPLIIEELFEPDIWEEVESCQKTVTKHHHKI